MLARPFMGLVGNPISPAICMSPIAPCADGWPALPGPAVIHALADDQSDEDQ